MSESPTFRRRSNVPSIGREMTGYVPVEDDYMEQSGVRGGRSCCLCVLITSLLFVAVTNALVTAGLLYFLSITHEGMTTVEFFDGENSVRVLSDVQVDDLVLHDQLVGRKDTDVVFSGNDLFFGQESGARLHIDGNKTILSSELFELLASDGKPLFSTRYALNLDLYQVKNLQASAIDVGSVTSREKFPDLHIESFRNLDIIGTEGVDVTSDREIELSSGQHVSMGTNLGTVVLESGEGIYIRPEQPLDGKGPDFSSDVPQLKLCICADSGLIFAVKDGGSNAGCHQVPADKHPCQV